MRKIRNFLWRILGFDYQTLLRKTDYTLLKSDKHTSIGKGTYDNGAQVWRWTTAPLSIGHYCSIAYGVCFIVDEGYHTISEITSYPFINDQNAGDYPDIVITQKEGIVIGHDVWIGMGAHIMPGVSIGNGVTIAANSVVTKDIPDFTVVAGAPAKPIRTKFTQAQIESLNRIQWWNWDTERLNARKHDFYLLSIEQFIEKYDN